MATIEYLQEEQKKIYEEHGYPSNIVSHYQINTNGNTDEQIRLHDKIWEKMSPYVQDNDIAYHIECREAERDFAYGLYGGLFFLGMFLSVLFTIAAVLILHRFFSVPLEDILLLPYLLPQCQKWGRCLLT